MSMSQQAWLNLLLTQAQKNKMASFPGDDNRVASLDEVNSLVKNGAQALPGSAAQTQKVSNPLDTIPQSSKSSRSGYSSSESMPVNLDALKGAGGSLGEALSQSNYAFPESLKNSQDSSQRLQDIIDQIPNKAQPDISALGDFANYATRGQYKSSYKPPETLTELMKNKGVLQAHAGNMNSDILKSLGNLLTSQVATKISSSKSSDTQVADKRSDEDLSKQVRLLDKSVGPIPAQIFYQLKQLNDEINNLPPGQNLPGAGPGVRFSPTFWLSDAGKRIRQNALGGAGLLKFLRTGAAGTDQEQERILEELGMGATSDDVSFLNGLKNLSGQIEAGLSARSAGFNSKIKDVYRQNGGRLAEDFETLNFIRGESYKSPDGAGQMTPEQELDIREKIKANTNKKNVEVK